MEDEKIVALYFERREEAIAETEKKYGGYLSSIAFHIVGDFEDARECVNDTYNDAWNSIPPHRPCVLSAFLGKITRRIAIDRLRRSHAQKRGGGELTLALGELSECCGEGQEIEDALEKKRLSEAVGTFLHRLPETQRSVFLSRYFYLDSIAEIAERFGFSESRVKSMLWRSREKLRRVLLEEDLL